MISNFTIQLDLSNPADAALLARIAQAVNGTTPVFGYAAPEIAKAAETEAQVQADEKPRRGRKPKTEGPVAEAEPVNPPPPQDQPAPVQIDGEAEEADETMAQENARDEAPPASPAQNIDTAEEFRAAMKAFIDAKGVPDTVEMLRKFGASKMSEVKPEDMGKVAAAMRAALAPASADPWA